MRQTLLIVFILICVGYNQDVLCQVGFRDSTLKNFLLLVDSSGRFDTSDISFKALRAYYYNDTTSLKELENYVKQQRVDRPNWNLWQSDIPLPKLNQLNVDVAFRFVFSVYDAPTYEVITITQKDTTHKLHYLRYYHNTDSGRFNKGKEFEKTISDKDWEEVLNKLYYGDFWGLKSDKDNRGRDGNDLTVIGYQKFDTEERNHYVHRWGNTTLNDAFYFVYYKLLNKHERLFVTD